MASINRPLAFARTRGRLTSGVAAAPFSPLFSTDWRQPLLAGFDSGGVIGTQLANSSTNKSLPYTQVAVSGTSAITVTSAGVQNGFPDVTVNATAHGLSVGTYVRAASTTTTPAGGANGLFKIATAATDSFTYVGNGGANFTATNAAIGGTFVSCTGTARDFSVKFDTVPAAGSFLFMDFYGSGGWTITWHESSDSVDGSAGSGSWTTNTFTPFTLPGAQLVIGPEANADQRGQLIPLTTSGWKRVHITNFDNAAALDFMMGAFKQRSASIKPDICAWVGSSIIQQDIFPRVARERIQNIDSTRDPLVINVGYQGAKVTDMQTLLTTWAAVGVAPGHLILSPGPNNTSPNRPYSTDPSQALVATQMQSILDYMRTTWGASIPVFCANMGHFNPTAAPAVNDLANPENGCEPYDSNQAEPKIRDGFPSYNWDTTFARPKLDELARFAVLPPGTASVPLFFLDGTTHPRSWVYEFTLQTIDSVHAYLKTGDIGSASCLTIVSDAETHGVPSWYKTRLQTIYGGTILSGSISSLLTRVNALATTYTNEPSGTKPTDMATQPTAWYDPADFDTITFATTALVSQINDRSPNANHLPQSTQAKQPLYVPAKRTGLGFLTAANDRKLGGAEAPAAMKGVLDAASQNFMIIFAVSSLGVGSLGAILGIGQAAANKLQVAPVNTDALGIAPSGNLRIVGATVGVPNGTTLLTETGFLDTYRWKICSVIYDGTTIFVRKNGVQTGSAAWAKPAWTGDSFTWLCNGPDLSRFIGYAGDLVVRTDYNLTDCATIETYLMNKWGAS